MNLTNARFQFKTVSMADGRTRYLLRAWTRTERGPLVVAAFGDWQGKLPARLAMLRGHIPADPMTGLRSSVVGEFLADITDVPEDGWKATAGRVDGTTLYSVVVEPELFTLKQGEEFVDCD